MTGPDGRARALRRGAAGLTALVVAAVLAGCGGEGQDRSCRAYLTYNDALAEAGTVAELRQALTQLRAGLPAEGDLEADSGLLRAAERIDEVLAGQSEDPQVYLQAAAGAEEACSTPRP